MTDFLLFTIYAPLASWGDIAVGEARGSWDRPSRSAVLGLVAAALGIVRDDQPAHDALDGGYGMAVRLDAAGLLMSDYHTAQTVAAVAARRARATTRAMLLAAGDRETILSRRTYREDAVSTVALWARSGAQWRLGEICDALRRPAFVLYAGRKSNPLGAPLAPEIVSASTLAEALRPRPALLAAIARGRVRLTSGTVEVAHDPCDGFEAGLRPLRRDTRRDRATHRLRWQFAEREVEVGLLDIAPTPDTVGVP